MNLSDRVYDLALFWSAAADVFPFFESLSLNWDEAFRQYLDRALRAEDELSYYLTLAEFGALLQDGHTGISVPRHLAQARGSLPFSLLPIGGKYYMGAAMESRRELLLSEVTHINGTPIGEILDGAARYIHRSDGHFYRGRAEGFLPLLLPKEGNVLQTDRGEWAFSMESTGEVAKPLPMMAAVTGEVLAEKPNMRVTRFPKGIVLVRLDDLLSRPLCELVKQTLLAEHDLGGVIFDIRGNMGGMTACGALLAGLFRKGSFSACRKKTRAGVSGIDAASATQMRRMGQAQIENMISAGLSTRENILRERRIISHTLLECYTDSFTGSGELEGTPCILLTSRNTLSAAEDFAAMFRSNHMGLLMGQPTYGSTGTPMLVPLSSGVTGRVCSVAYSLLDGTAFLNRGIMPDICMEPSREDYLAGNDRLLSFAIRHLME